jgi:hypothetical protein
MRSPDFCSSLLGQVLYLAASLKDLLIFVVILTPKDLVRVVDSSGGKHH